MHMLLSAHAPSCLPPPPSHAPSSFFRLSSLFPVSSRLRPLALTLEVVDGTRWPGVWMDCPNGSSKRRR
eukprot:3939649-Rhodomonas_salina.5